VPWQSCGQALDPPPQRGDVQMRVTTDNLNLDPPGDILELDRIYG
jgi:hypothetical protein